MTLEMGVERESFPLQRPFTIARGTTETAELVFVEVTDEHGQTGVGAAGPSRYYGETAETVAAILSDLEAEVQATEDPFDRAALRDRLADVGRGNPAARAAIDIAVHDLCAKRAGVPLANLLGLGTDPRIESSFTIGIADPEVMAERAASAVETGHGVLKIKLDSDGVSERLEAIREVVPDVRIRVDANASWTPGTAIRLAQICAEADVEFIEQPVAASDLEGLGRVRDRSPVPIAADESCVTLSDIPRIAGRVDIATLKLMKCGGISETIRMVHVARAHGLEVMLGCMVESSVSIAAGAHLAAALDYADLDGALLLADDRFSGSHVRPGQITIDTETSGLGIQRS